MIFTDVQYQNTVELAEKFQTAIAKLSQIPAAEIADTDVHEVEIDSLRQQLIQLEVEIAEYKQTKSGDEKIIVSSLKTLGQSLVKARIKAGVERETLAKRLDVDISQIISYETEFYSTISVAKIRQIAKILEVEILDEVLPPTFSGKIREIFAKLKKVGLEREFIISRLISSENLINPTEKTVIDINDYTVRLCIYLNQVFGWKIDDLISSKPLTVSSVDLDTVKFKVQSNRKLEKVVAYSKYVKHLASVAAKSAAILDKKTIPTDPVKMRKAIVDTYGSINLQNVANFAWDCGVIVLPLNDKGNSYGVCIRIDGRNVILLNPRRKSTSNWLFDLLHELYHAGQEPENKSFGKIFGEVTSEERRLSQEEKDANNYASEVIFEGKANLLFEKCKAIANNNPTFFKKAILKVASENQVMVGALAHHVAYRLGKKYPNLWAVANKLQPTNENPYNITRGIFIERFPFYIEDQFDKELLEQAFEGVPVMKVIKPEDDEKITCTSYDCENNLHCFKKTRKMTPEQIGTCRNCGADLVDWKRVHERAKSDIEYTFNSLKYECIRHHFFEKTVDIKSLNHAIRKGRIKLNEAIKSRLEKYLAPSEIKWDGRQTPFNGNIIYYAQHATATCCRTCLEYWHDIPKGTKLTQKQFDYCVELISRYLDEKLPDLADEGKRVPPF